MNRQHIYNVMKKMHELEKKLEVGIKLFKDGETKKEMVDNGRRRNLDSVDGQA